MSDFIKWANTGQTVLYIQAPQTVSDEDAPSILRDVHQKISSVKHPVTLIIDRRKTINVPKKTLVVMRKLISQGSYQQVVFVGFSMFPKMLVETLSKIPGTFLSAPIFVDTLEEAYKTIGITDGIMFDETKSQKSC